MIVPPHIPTKFRSSSSYQKPFKALTLPSLLKSGYGPSIHSLNLLLSFLIKARKSQLVLQIFSQVSSNSIEIDSWTHSLVARALLQARRFKEAEEFISHAKNYDVVPRKSLWDSLIRGVCVSGEDPEAALSLLHECVSNRRILPSPNTFRSLVFSFSSQGKMGRAIEVSEAMTSEEIGYPFDNFVCSSIISGFCKIGKPEHGLGFYDRAVKDRDFRPNLITYTAVVDALCKEGRIDEASDLVRRMENEGMALDAVLYSSWICGYLRKGFLMEGLRKHRLMVEKGKLPDVVSYTNLINGFCKEGNVEKVIGFFCEMESSGVEPNLVTYTALIQGFCKRNKLEEAFCVLRKIEELGIILDELMYSVLINGLCRKGDLDGVFSLLEEMESKGIEVGCVTYNTVINGLCKAGKTCKADEISRGYFGDNFTYSTLLHGYMKEMDVGGVKETKRRFETAGICIDIVTCNVLIKVMFMVGMVEDAFMLFEEMPEKGIIANSITYCTMVDGYCKLGMIDKALVVFDEYKRNLPTDSITHKMLIRAHFKEGNGEGVLKFIQILEKLEPDFLSDICNDALAFLYTKGCFAAALDIYILLRKRDLAVTNKSFYVLLKCLIHSRDKELVQLLMSDYIKAFGMFEDRMIDVMSLYLCQKNLEAAIPFLSNTGKENISVGVLTTVVDALKKEGRVRDAHTFLMEAEENGASADIVVYSIVVDGLCKEGNLEKALDLCARMEKEGIYPNIVIYNSVINGLCRQGCLVEAFRLYDSLEGKSVSPTIITYATLIGALCREGFLQDARKLFERMVRKGIDPNSHVYNLLISGYCSFGLMEDALKLLSDLESCCLQPDAFTISAVISGFCLKGDIEGALGFFGEYRGRGFSPDFLGFLNLIKGLITKGRMEEARTILRDMLRREEVMDLINRAGKELHGESLVSLLDLACEQGRIQEAIDVLGEVGFMSFSSWRSNGARRLGRLKKLQDTGALDAGKGGIYRTTVEVPRETHGRLKWQCATEDLVDTNHRSGKMEKEDNGVEDYGYLMGKSLCYDFDTYYPIIASLCSRGELKQANNIVKAMVMNSGKNC